MHFSSPSKITCLVGTPEVELAVAALFLLFVIIVYILPWLVRRVLLSVFCSVVVLCGGRKVNFHLKPPCTEIVRRECFCTNPDLSGQGRKCCSAAPNKNQPN